MFVFWADTWGCYTLEIVGTVPSVNISPTPNGCLLWGRLEAGFTVNICHLHLKLSSYPGGGPEKPGGGGGNPGGKPAGGLKPGGGPGMPGGANGIGGRARGS